MGKKACDIPCRADHAGSLIHYNDAAGAEQTASSLNGLVIEIYLLNLLRAQHRHRRPARNHALESLTVRHAAAVLVEKLHERITHLQFIDAGFPDVAAHAEELGAFALFRSHGRVRPGAVFDDPGKRRQSFNIVNHRRTTEKTMGCRKRRFKLWPPSPTL